jgi:hypothetical protein
VPRRYSAAFSSTEIRRGLGGALGGGLGGGKGTSVRDATGVHMCTPCKESQGIELWVDPSKRSVEEEYALIIIIIIIIITQKATSRHPQSFPDPQTLVAGDNTQASRAHYSQKEQDSESTRKRREKDAAKTLPGC